MSALCLVHSRYSTNTIGAWDLAHPFRYLAHNGEINTVRGNRTGCAPARARCAPSCFGDDLQKLYPIIREGSLDSARFDNALEFLVPGGSRASRGDADDDPGGLGEPGRHGPGSAGLLRVPLVPAWSPGTGRPRSAFTDGRKIGAVLDRNGLRPSRYVVTKDGFVVMASESGVADTPPENVLVKERLHPGKIFLVDLEAGPHPRRRGDQAPTTSHASPTASGSSATGCVLTDLPPAAGPEEREDPEQRFTAPAGLRLHEGGSQGPDRPMASQGKWPIGSMGEDAALACLSDRPQMLYRYFKQLFAQVSNPAMDSINERPVMALYSTLGSEGNLLEETEEHARMIRVPHPVICNAELEKLRQIDQPGFQSRTLSCLFPVGDGGDGLRGGLDRLCAEAEQAVREGVNILILSDRGVSPELAPIPMLLATGAVHHHLIRETLRTRCGIVCETGEAREVAHMALLIGYGAAAINPYLALSTIEELVEDGTYVPDGLESPSAVKNFIKANDKGLLKTFAKMGISTLQSYRGAQIFEAIGLDRELVARCFTGTRRGCPAWATTCSPARRPCATPGPSRGTSSSIRSSIPAGSTSGAPRRAPHLQPGHRFEAADRAAPGELRDYKEFSRAANDDAERPAPCADCSSFKSADQPPVPARRGGARHRDREALLHRRHELRLDLARGAPDARHRDEPPGRQEQHGRGRRGPGSRFTPEPNGDLRRSAIKQVASGPLRRDELVSGQLRRDADQDRPGGQARRGRRASRATR